MNARDLFGRTVRYWKITVVVLAITTTLLGSVYYKVDDVYTVYHGNSFKSSLSDESRTTDNKLYTSKGSTFVSIRNKSNVKSVKRNIGVKEGKRNLAEDYNKLMPEDTADTVNLDLNSDSDSYNRNKLDNRNPENTKNTDKETSDRSSLPFINTDRKIKNEFTTGSISQVIKNGNALTLEGPPSPGRFDDKDDDVRSRGKTSGYFRIIPESQFGSPDITKKYFLGKLKTLAKKGRNPKKFPTLKYDIPVGPESAYAVKDLGLLRINKTNGSTFVLLVTYARSGSSWLGAITNQAEESFYVFEPFQRFIFQGYYKENQICYNNNTCREPRSLLETHYYAITALHRLFTCQFTKMHPKAVNILIRNVRSGDVRKCLLSFLSIQRCLQELEEVCMSTTHRVIKTIRISMELVNQMMDLWPNLKVVHLVRDPRGITNSRLKNGSFPMTRKIIPHSLNMCKRMYNDVTHNVLLEKKYENRIKLVIYEALAERPEEGMEFIYGFLNMKITKDVITWMYNSTHAQNKTGYFGTMRTDATKSAYYWKTKLTLNKITIIDRICYDVYKLLGFLPINSRTESQKSSFLSRQSIKHADWFT